MINRKIQIADNRSQKRYVIETNATTLGELQDQMDIQGIDYHGLSFTEGISKTQLLTRDSLLPTNVMFKGQPTNDLVILLTNTTKNIASGAYPTNRKEFSEYIKKNNLGDKIKQKFGDNWTRISTNDLVNFFIVEDKKISKAIAETGENKQKLEEVREELAAGKVSKPALETSVEEVPKTTVLPDIKEAPHAKTVNWLYDGIKGMASEHLLQPEDIIVLASLTTEFASRLWEEKPNISFKDVEDIIAGL